LHRVIAHRNILTRISNIDKLNMRWYIPFLMVPLNSLFNNNEWLSQVCTTSCPKYTLYITTRQDEFNLGTAGSGELIQYYWNLQPISKFKYTQAQGFLQEYWSKIEELTAWMWWIVLRYVWTQAAPQYKKKRQLHSHV